MDNDDPLSAGEDFARVDDMAGPVGLADPHLEDVFELELDGEVHTLPGALKGAFLRQADYTRKTQELAEHRRAMETQRQALDSEARAIRGGNVDQIRLSALDHQLAEFEGIDWESYGAQDPEGAQTMWAAFQELGQVRDELAYALTHRQERDRLEQAREAAVRMEAVGRTLRDEIEGWSPEVAAKLVDYAQAFGVTLEELREVADPRLWKILHRAYQADQAGQREVAGQAHGVRPAVVVAGASAGAGPVRDELGTKEWMRRRNEQMARGR